MKLVGKAARKFFLTRHLDRSWIGPYVVTTVEVRPGALETTVTWGEGGLQVEQFGSGLAFDLERADELHDAVCVRVEEEVGVARIPAPLPPAA